MQPDNVHLQLIVYIHKMRRRFCGIHPRPYHRVVSSIRGVIHFPIFFIDNNKYEIIFDWMSGIEWFGDTFLQQSLSSKHCLSCARRSAHGLLSANSSPSSLNANGIFFVFFYLKSRKYSKNPLRRNFSDIRVRLESSKKIYPIHIEMS